MFLLGALLLIIDIGVYDISRHWLILIVGWSLLLEAVHVGLKLRASNTILTKLLHSHWLSSLSCCKGILDRLELLFGVRISTRRLLLELHRLFL